MKLNRQEQMMIDGLIEDGLVRKVDPNQLDAKDGKLVFSDRPVLFKTQQAQRKIQLSLNSMSKKHLNFYVPRKQRLPKSIEAFITTLNEQTLDELDDNKWKKLDAQLSPLSDESTLDVALMHRYVQQREQFIRENDMVSAELALDYLGESKSNVARKINELIKRNQLLVIKHNGKNLIPEFQFNAKGAVYNEIISILNNADKSGVTPLELALWLTSERTEVQAQSHQPSNLKAKDKVALATLLTQIEKDTIEYTGRPIDWLENKETVPFNSALTQWLPAAIQGQAEGTVDHA